MQLKQFVKHCRQHARRKQPHHKEYRDNAASPRTEREPRSWARKPTHDVDNEQRHLSSSLARAKQSDSDRTPRTHDTSTCSGTPKQQSRNDSDSLKGQRI
jgi:hypothetical protein